MLPLTIYTTHERHWKQTPQCLAILRNYFILLSKRLIHSYDIDLNTDNHYENDSGL